MSFILPFVFFAQPSDGHHWRTSMAMASVANFWKAEEIDEKKHQIENVQHVNMQQNFIQHEFIPLYFVVFMDGWMGRRLGRTFCKILYGTCCSAGQYELCPNEHQRTCVAYRIISKFWFVILFLPSSFGFKFNVDTIASS